MYIAQQGILLAGKTVDIAFTSGRKDNGLSADISIEDTVATSDASEAVVPVEAVVVAIKPVLVAFKPGVTENMPAAETPKVEVADEPVPFSGLLAPAKSLFG